MHGDEKSYNKAKLIPFHIDKTFNEGAYIKKTTKWKLESIRRVHNGYRSHCLRGNII
jgi:hypothetical protein